MMLFVIYGVIKGFTVRSITTLDPELLLLTFCMLAKHWSNLSTSPTTHGTLYSLSFLNGKTFCFLMKPTFHVLDPRSEKRNPIWAHRRVATNKTHIKEILIRQFSTLATFVFSSSSYIPKTTLPIWENWGATETFELLKSLYLYVALSKSLRQQDKVFQYTMPLLLCLEEVNFCAI